MVRDPSGICHLFYSRWPYAKGFNAWVSHSEVARATATDPLGPYTHRDVVLPMRGPGFWDGHSTHNPTVLEHQGHYYLYYSGNSGNRKPAKAADTWDWWVHRNNQRIGVAVASHPSGPWERSDTPLIDISSEQTESDSLMVSNPTATHRPDGGFLLIYKAVGTEGILPFGGPVVHRVALADSPAGPFVKQPPPVFTVANDLFPAEDPFVWRSDNRYQALIKDMHGVFTHAGTSLALFESEEGFHWRRANPCMVSDRSIRFEDGTAKQFDNLERPQVFFNQGRPSVLFCAVRDGDDTFNIHIPLAPPGGRI